MFPSEVRRAGGPIPKFTDYHIWKALMVLDPSKPMGRKALAGYLNIGEGSARTILNVFTEQELVDINKNGILLTKKGNDAKNMMALDVKIISLDDLTIGEKDCIVRVPKASKKVTYGCEERDTAIKAGAVGATTLICANNRLVFPGSDYPLDDALEEKIRNEVKVKNDDVVIVGTADSYEVAEIGAVTAALGIMGGLRINRELNDILNPRSAPLRSCRWRSRYTTSSADFRSVRRAATISASELRGAWSSTTPTPGRSLRK